MNLVYAKSNAQKQLHRLSLIAVMMVSLPILAFSQDIAIEAQASCLDDSGGNVAADTYFIEISDVSGGDGGPYTVEIGGSSASFDGSGSVFLGPFTRSTEGGGVQVVTATDGTGDDGFAEVPEVICGITTDNGLNASGPFCVPSTDPTLGSQGAILVQSAPGSFMAGGTSGQVQQYAVADDNGTIVQSNLNGLFEGLPNGTYSVYAINYRSDETAVQAALTPGNSIQPLIDGAAMPATGDLAGACYSLCDADPIEVGCVSVGSTVFVDNENDGLFNNDDVGIEDVIVNLFFDANGDEMIDGDEAITPIATTTTDENGDYFFGGLAEGKYIVSVPFAPEEFPASSDNIATSEADNQTDNDDNGTQNITTDAFDSPIIMLMLDTEPTNGTGPNDEGGSGADQDGAVDDDDGDMTVDFGFIPGVSVGSTVFSDLDNDGTFEPQDGENGIEGVEVELYDLGPDGVKGGGDDSLIATEVTDSDGNYLFDELVEGDY
ncbi:MAG: SdrD B-like domain-containing protein, partial [Bacteroidota bacterium]